MWIESVAGFYEKAAQTPSPVAQVNEQIGDVGGDFSIG